MEAPPGIAGHDRITVTFAELERQAAALAARLDGLAAPDALIAVLLPRHSPRLYAAQLGILRAGAAFTCLDPSFPDAHFAAVLCDAVAVITDAAGRARLAALGIEIPVVPAEAADALTSSAPAAAIAPSRLAYVIYTSGTTGQPKGVMVEHGSIANLVEADREYFRLGSDARVAQCSSPAYDSSIEETWLALAAGATLVLLDDATVRLGPDLVPWLRQERISVFCPPPTLLRATGCEHPERELPALKLLYVGGEALPQDLAERWARGRWLENGYGPTECTVTAMRARIRPGEPVTIGHPVAGCWAWVLDGRLEEVRGGETGELCLGGACLARGYRNDDALTGERFIEHPRFGRIYRTGDRARRTSKGALEYLGRMDAQVKLRGYRIELEAVETALAACAGVRAAACRIEDGVLAAHLVAAGGRAPRFDALKHVLRQSLPGYMVPARFGYLPALPVSAAGKLDRDRLPAAPRTAAADGRPRRLVAPGNAAERAVAAAFAAALKLDDTVSTDDDFFLDLGGDSLSAVAAIVRLREAGWNAGVRSLYEARSARALAAAIEPARAPEPEPDTKSPPPTPSSTARPAWCTTAQAAWLGLECFVAGALAYAIGFRLLPGLFERLPPLPAALAVLGLSLAALALYLPLSVAWVVLLKRVLIGHYQPGREPVWSGFYLRHWIVTHSARHIPWGWMQGTEVQARALRRLGARVGERVYLHRGVDLARGGWDLLALGDGATVGQDASLRLADLDSGHVVVGPITVGAGATLETRAGMDAGSSLGPGAYLGPLSWLPGGVRVPAGERWDGAPAEPSGPAPLPAAVADARPLPIPIHTALALLSVNGGLLLGWLPWLVAAAVLPASLAVGFASWLQAPAFSIPGVIALALLAALGVAAMLALDAAAARWFGAVPAGVYSQWSWTAIRIQAAGARVESAGLWLAGTLLWPLWLRAAGMEVGRGCEISTILDVLPASVSIGAGSFLADGVYLAGPRRLRGTVTVARTRLGRGTFLGNHAVVPAGFDWPDNLFVGVATVPDPAQAHSGSAWFGLPPLELPRRAAPADPRLAQPPTPLRYATRLLWELARFALPLVPLLVLAGWSDGLEAAYARLSPWALALAAAPALTLAAALALPAAIVLLKWALLGRVRPGERAFWSCWCGRWDFLYMAWENWGRSVLGQLDGTLLLNQFLRLTGVRIGRRVALGPGFVQLVDPDMLAIEDGATVSGHIQSHTFEDRILKMDRVQIGAAATLGDQSVALYGASLGAGARVAPHGVVMKYDRIPPAAAYAGAPARPAAPVHEPLAVAGSH